jgi:hypothetical protein
MRKIGGESDRRGEGVLRKKTSGGCSCKPLKTLAKLKVSPMIRRKTPVP